MHALARLPPVPPRRGPSLFHCFNEGSFSVFSFVSDNDNDNAVTVI